MVPIGQVWGAGKELSPTQHSFNGEGMKPSPPGGLPYRGRSKKMCMANGDTCRGFRSSGTEYCAGHQRSLGLLKPKVEEVVDGDTARTT
jgi:hypothetical protein